MVEFRHYNQPRYEIGGNNGFIIGRTEAMLSLFQRLNCLADLPTTVLLTGESGTGKELCAKSLHYNGSNKRHEGLFVAVNCAGIPSELLENELFGHVRGAYTGAHITTGGKFEHANRGTIFLDEIGDMSLHLQAKILRVLQERQIVPVGGNAAKNVDVRIIAATNKDLEKEMKEGRFRVDLYYRLNVVPIKVPPLRERREDIPLIAGFLIDKLNREYRAEISGLSSGATERLTDYDWPGNVRELENIIERVFVMRGEGEVQKGDIILHGELPLITGFAVVTRPTDKQEEDSGRRSLTGISKLWYRDGVFPIAVAGLAQIDGTKDRSKMPDMIKSRKDIYYLDFPEGSKSRYVVFLTPDNIHLFFSDTSSQGYKDLEAKVKEGEFNEIVRSPFKVFSVQDLVKNPNCLNFDWGIIKAAQEAGVYQISAGKKFHFYVVTPDQAKHFVPSRPKQGRRLKIDSLKEEIEQEYDRFTSWIPQ